MAKFSVCPVPEFAFLDNKETSQNHRFRNSNFVWQSSKVANRKSFAINLRFCHELEITESLTKWEVFKVPLFLIPVISYLGESRNFSYFLVSKILGPNIKLKNKHSSKADLFADSIRTGTLSSFHRTFQGLHFETLIHAGYSDVYIVT